MRVRYAGRELNWPFDSERRTWRVEAPGDKIDGTAVSAGLGLWMLVGFEGVIQADERERAELIAAGLEPRYRLWGGGA